MKTAFLFAVPCLVMAFAFWIVGGMFEPYQSQTDFLPEVATLSGASMQVVRVSTGNLKQRIEISKARLGFVEMDLEQLRHPYKNNMDTIAALKQKLDSISRDTATIPILDFHEKPMYRIQWSPGETMLFRFDTTVAAGTKNLFTTDQL